MIVLCQIGLCQIDKAHHIVVCERIAMRSPALRIPTFLTGILSFSGKDRLCRAFLVSILLLPALAVGDGSTQNETTPIPAAFALYKEMAEQGDVEAQFNLGMMCETGWSVPVDYKKAVRWYREAANQGHANAQIRLGMLYYLGIGTQQSEIRGQKWIREAAKQNNALASELYKKVFSDEVPNALVPATTIKRVRDIYLKDEKRALVELERMVSDARQQDARAEKLKQESTMRERRVQRLADGSLKPEFSVPAEAERIKNVVPGFIGDASLEENRTLARGSVATIRLQAEKGLASAQYNLGRMYELGIKLPVDKRQAMEWYRKSALQEYADAEYRLGIALLYGVGVAQDEVQGKQWLTKAAKHQHPVAQKLVEGMRNSLESATVSLAASWYLERALGGDAKSSFHLGKLYQYGWGVEPDRNEAIKWYQRASSLGFKDVDPVLAALMAEPTTTADRVAKGNALEALLEKYSLPVWLAHPGVIALLIIVVLWLVFFRRGVRKRKGGEQQEEIQEI